MKPITWFPPMWAFACGVVASGVPMAGKWWLALVGVLLFNLFYVFLLRVVIPRVG